MKQAVRRKYHYIYKITRIDTGRFYIGMHSTDDLDDGYFGSGKIITASIKKHGKDKHTKEILEQLPSREALKLRERELVNSFLIQNSLCMNLKVGGEGGWDHLNQGSDEHRQRCSRAGKIGCRHDALIKWSKSEEGRKKSGAAFKKLHADGKMKYNNMEGKSHSQQTKDKMSLSHSGMKNARFGQMWIYNDELRISKTIEKGSTIPENWKKGRRMYV